MANLTITLDDELLRKARVRAAAGVLDALVVEAAQSRGCTRLLSEDLQDGRDFGRLRIENPFAKPEI